MSDAHQRWWSGIAWTEHVREMPASAPVVVAPAWATTRLRNTPATRALVLGIVVAALAAVPYLTIPAIAVAVIAITLGILGARRSTLTGSGLPKSLVGIGLAVVGIGLAATLGVHLTGLVGSPTLQPQAQIRSPSVAAPYKRIADTELTALLTSPDVARGTRVILNGRVTATDRATCAFSASITNVDRDAKYAGVAWFARPSDCTSLRRGDLIKIWATVQGSHGSTPALSATKVTKH